MPQSLDVPSWRIATSEELIAYTTSIVEGTKAKGGYLVVRSKLTQIDMYSYTQLRDQGFSAHKKRISKMYDLRSRLVHGSLSPFDPEVRAKRWICLELAEDVLRSALPVFGKNDAFETLGDVEQLKKGLERLVSWAKDADALRSG